MPYPRDEVLTESERALDEIGYALEHLDVRDWNEERLHESVASLFDFPDYYGRNMNSLADCLSDVACGEYGWDPTGTGLAVTLHGFGPFARRNASLAQALAEQLVVASRKALLFGHRILWLLHVDDPDFNLEPVGASSITWNAREWLHSHRL